MDEQANKNKSFVKVVAWFLIVGIVLLVIITALSIALIHYMPSPFPEKKIIATGFHANGSFTNVDTQTALEKANDTLNYWKAPAVAALEGNPDKEIILYGRDLIAHTSEYFGAHGKIFKSSTNGMNCQNCHLDAGTKVFGNNYSAVASTYPKYRARSGTIENIYKRINDCFERSLNGEALDTASKEMQAIAAYVKWLGKDVPENKKPPGSGLKDLTFLERAANPENGKLIYSQKCLSCHQPSGEGLMNAGETAYTYPPLWGEHSYNNGAGLFRLSNFAKFVKYNMPVGASHNNAKLTDEEAWDVAAFVNSQPRPGKNIKKDWPLIEEKPFDNPFGPYADGFDEKQHKFGPFKPIQEKLALLKKKKINS